MSDTVYWVHIGRLFFGPVYSYAEACRLSQGEAGGSVTNCVPPEGDVVPLSKLAKNGNGHKALVKPVVRNRDSVKVIDATTGEIGWRRAFELGPTGLVVNGKPTIRQWIRYGAFLTRAHEGLQWAIGDWINYGERREDWDGKYDQALAMLPYDYGYLRNIASVCGRYPVSLRSDTPEAVTFSHHAAVVNVPEPKRGEILTKVKTEGLSVTETQVEGSIATGKPIYLKGPTFEGNLQQAVDWIAGQKFARGWDKQVKIVLYEVQKP